MKRRYRFLLLWAAPALLAAIAASVLLAGAAAGLLWLFVFGDDPWPGWAEGALMLVLAGVAAAIWAGLLFLAYAAGTRREDSVPKTVDFVAPAAATVALVLLIVAHQASVGNLSVASDSRMCSQLCLDRGFAASGTPPRNAGAEVCTCYDANGRAALSLTMKDRTEPRQ